jgi:hypothetical protein
MNSAAQVGTRHVPVLKIPTEAHWSATQSRGPDACRCATAPVSRRPAVANERDRDTPLSLLRL